MRFEPGIRHLMVAGFLAVALWVTLTPPLPRPPVARLEPVTRTVHGETLTDPYAWLRAPDWQDAISAIERMPRDIRRFIDGENAYAAAMLAPAKAVEDRMFEEMRARLQEDEQTTPLPDGPFDYYDRGVKGAEYGLVLRRPRGGGAEEVVLDVNELAEGTDYFSLGSYTHSPDHRLVAYSSDTEGAERYTIRIREIAGGRELPDRIDTTDGTIIWSPDGASLYYVALNAELRAYKVLRHRLGQPAETDETIYEEPPGGDLVTIWRTQDRRFLVVSTGTTTSSDARILDLNDPDARAVMMVPRAPDARRPRPRRGRLLCADQRWRQSRLPHPRRARRRARSHEVDRGRAHVVGRPITEFVVYKDFLVWTEEHDGLAHIRIRRLADGAEHEIAFGEEAYEAGPAPGYEYDTRRLVYSYSSMTTPLEVYGYDLETRERTLLRRQQVPSGHDPANYVTKRVYATAPDGERVPVSLLYGRDTPLDGTAPLLLDGYGAYGSSGEASFDIGRLSLVDRGFVYAIAHVRGGYERGERWYEQGRGPNKLNTMRDFIAVAEHLSKERIVDGSRMIAIGGSAGGILVGAVANMKPELFKGIVADVPFVDVLNTMLDDTLPLTPNEFPEWGNPITDKAAFDLIRSYSPYENVAARPYPEMLILGSLSDTRVTYWEPAKWAARLQAATTSKRPILLEIEIDAGHAGVSGQLKSLRRAAHIYAFVDSVARQP
ncbi:MAG: S9 family peptidase [Hyphomicrobiaceae bacterium]